MKRDLLQKLIDWKDSLLRKPLILRGARQVGKSWLINELGKQFDSFVKIDFDRDQKAKSLLMIIPLYGIELGCDPNRFNVRVSNAPIGHTQQFQLTDLG